MGEFQLITTTTRNVAKWASDAIEKDMASSDVGIGGVLLEQACQFKALGCHPWDVLTRVNGQRATEFEYLRVLDCLTNGIESEWEMSFICPHDGARWRVTAKIVKKPPAVTNDLDTSP